MLMLTEQFDLLAEDLIEAVYLPTDDDKDFQKLSMAFTQPTKHDILHYDVRGSIYRQNRFDLIFFYIFEASDCSLSSKYAAHSLFRILLGSAKVGPRLTMSTTFGSKIPFEIDTVRGILRCGGAICRTNNAFPLVTIWIANDQCDTCATPHEISQILVQGILANNHNPTLDSHSVFVVRMDRTVLRLTRAFIPRGYIEELYQGRPIREGLQLSHSEMYDLQEPDRRREALRLFNGLFRFLDMETTK